MSTIGSTSARTDDLTAGWMIESEQIDLQQQMRDARVLDEAASVLKGAGSLLWKTA